MQPDRMLVYNFKEQKMHKTLAAIILSMLILPAATLNGAIYEIQGQVTGGYSLFPPVVQDLSISPGEFGVPVGGFPVDFEARLELGAEPTDWSFEFVVTDEVRSVEYLVAVPAPSEHNTKSDKNNVTLLPEQIEIEMSSYRVDWEGFNLSLDLNAGTGRWDWAQDCPECDLLYSLPAATATVTSISAVPEPSTGMIGLIASVFSFAISRRSRCKRQ